MRPEMTASGAFSAGPAAQRAWQLLFHSKSSLKESAQPNLALLTVSLAVAAQAEVGDQAAAAGAAEEVDGEEAVRAAKPNREQVKRPMSSTFPTTTIQPSLQPTKTTTSTRCTTPMATRLLRRGGTSKPKQVKLRYSWIGFISRRKAVL